MSTTPETRAQPRPVVGESLHAALAAGERPPRPSALSTCLTFGWRGMLKIKHVPEQLIDVSLTPGRRNCRYSSVEPATAPPNR